MQKFKYALFYDFHTLASNPDVGKNFDVEAFTDQIKSCGVDFLTFHARCNQGNAYYNTKIGRRHPSLKYDLVKEICDSCAKKGIRLSLYFNGHLSEEETLAHPEWSDVPFRPDEACREKSNPFYHQVCYNSSFREHLKDMALELAENYKFDGFFFDCLGASNCVCPRCTAEMIKLGIDWKNETEVRKFSAMSAHRMCVFLNNAIRGVMPDALLFFNGRPFEEVVNMESHLECECLPTDAGLGYDGLPAFAHYMRTVAGPDKSILNMTARFNSWSDFGGLRTKEGIEFDLFYGTANGMRPDIGGHFHPRGDMDLPVFDLIRDLYGTIRLYDEWTLDAINECDTAIVYPRNKNCYIPSSEKGILHSAIRILDELKVQFDLVSEFASWEKYKLLVFPDDVVFSQEIANRVADHLARGGKVFATARSGLTPDGSAFALKNWPAVYLKSIDYNPLFFKPEGKYAEGLPDMPLSVYANGTCVRPANNATVEMFCVKPYINRGWDGFHGNCYTPPDKTTEDPFLLENENIVYVSGELFAGYRKRGPRQFRTLISNIFESLNPFPLLRTARLPSFARAFVQRKDTRTMVHLLAYCPEKRGECIIVEDRVCVVNAEISLRTEDKQIHKVYLAPERKMLDFTQKNGYCTVTIPLFSGYALLVFE